MGWMRVVKHLVRRSLGWAEEWEKSFVLLEVGGTYLHSFLPAVAMTVGTWCQGSTLFSSTLLGGEGAWKSLGTTSLSPRMLT